MSFFCYISNRIPAWLEKKAGLLAPTHDGISAKPANWLSVDSLHKLAVKYLHDSVGADLSEKPDRIAIRPAKGIVKFVFADHYMGLQIDCTNGKLFLIERRSSDFIENIHDGTILDKLFGTGEKSMLGNTTVMGISLFMLTVTGLWLWYGPKKLRKSKKAKADS